MPLDLWESTAAAAARRHAKRRPCFWRIFKCFTSSYQKHFECECVLKVKQLNFEKVVICNPRINSLERRFSDDAAYISTQRYDYRVLNG